MFQAIVLTQLWSEKMTKETILTIEDIRIAAQAAGCNPSADDGALVLRLSRAIEQAVLKSTEMQALRKDAERIEWLEAQTKKSYTGISFDYHRYVEDGYVVDHGYRFMRRHFASGFMDSLRKAIDAAMENQE